MILKSAESDCFSMSQKFISPVQKTLKWPTVNQHPGVRNEGWMVSGQETVLCQVPVP
jgi:hypothetical protein